MARRSSRSGWLARPEHHNGNQVTFKPSTGTFTKVEYEFAILERRLRELAFLNSGLAITVQDDRVLPVERAEFKFDGGLVAFIEWLDRGKEPVFKQPISLISKETEGIRVELAMWWTNSPRELALCFTNNIPQRDGGTHQAGFRQALTRVVMKYAEDLAKKEKVELIGEDMREGLTAVLSVKGAGPEILFADQGQAGVVRGAAGGPCGGGGRHQPLVRNPSERGQAGARPGWS